MNHIFSLKRLLLLIKKHGIEHAKLYGLSSLALFGIMAFVFLFWFATSGPRYHEEALYGIFLFGLFIAGGVFASMAFQMLSAKDKGIYWLAFPASHLEKLVCAIFYSTIVFFIIYCACFLVLKTIFMSYLESRIAEKLPITISRMNWEQKNGFGEAFPYFIYAFFAVQALYLLGSVYFSRFAFIKTTIAGALFIFIFILYVKEVSEFLLNNASWQGFKIVEYNSDYSSSKQYNLSQTVKDTLKFLLCFAWAPIFWVTALFRLKEKEI